MNPKADSPIWTESASPGSGLDVPADVPRQQIEETVRLAEECPILARRIAERVRPYQRRPRPPLPSVPPDHVCRACALAEGDDPK